MRHETVPTKLQERLEFLKEDLKNLFNDKGVDQSQYDEKVNFMDPITKYDSVKGIADALRNPGTPIWPPKQQCKAEVESESTYGLPQGSLAGYMFNISMLKRIFQPTFQLHDIKQTAELEVTTRWTMIMTPTINRLLRIQRWWDPRLIFTGVSIMGVNPKNGES